LFCTIEVEPFILIIQFILESRASYCLHEEGDVEGVEGVGEHVAVVGFIFDEFLKVFDDEGFALLGGRIS
jgi:hypothetical protein